MPRIVFFAIVAVALTSSSISEAFVQATDTEVFGIASLLDVPYLPQTEALCGGASAAMVLRYWGERDVYPEDFVSLVVDGRRGIPTDALVAAIRRRGWHALAFRGTTRLARAHLLKGRPLLVLLEESPGVFHYVVWVGWLGGHVVLHDPARQPHRLLKEDDFEEAWRASDYWTVLIVPSRNVTSRPLAGTTALDASRFAPTTCSPILEEAARLAREEDWAAAEELLTTSTVVCPGSSGPFRELAGVHFLQSHWIEAARFAEQAVALDPEDAHAWRTLAASRFLADDPEGALRAWNELNEPQVDTIRIDGLQRTRYNVVADVVDLPPRTLLSGAKLRLAARRVSALPTTETASRVGYRPLPDGVAELEVAVVERPLLPDSPPALAALALNAALERRLSVNVSSPTGRGEIWSASWRWWQDRPRVGVSLALPGLFGAPGIWRVEGFWEQQTYGVGATDGSTTTPTVREERRRAALTVSDWKDADSRWEVLAAIDRWEARGAYLSVSGGVEKRLASDRAALRLEGAGWSSPWNDDRSIGVGALRAGWRSSKTSKSILVGRAGLELASSNAPFALWPGAGTGHARAPLLRAHPLLEGGELRGEAFGRSLLHGGVEFQHWVSRPGLGFAVFVDVAKAARRVSGDDTRLLADVGGGLRVKLFGEERTLRVDLARGLRGGDFTLSVGWELPWPGWQ